MEKTWASGALELLKHADSHIQKDSAFDSRVALISVDNSVEVCIRVYLSLPEEISGIAVTRREKDDAGNSFPKMVKLLFDKAADKILGLVSGDLEYYHRIRNQLYHDGTGLAVDKDQLNAYREIASVLLNNLFGIEIKSGHGNISVANLILLHNEVEGLVKGKWEASGIDTGHTFKWEMAMEDGVLTFDQIKALTDLRMIRNIEIHGQTDIGHARVKYAIDIAELLISELRC